MCRKFNTCDSLLCVNVRIRDIVVCPVSTIFHSFLRVHYIVDIGVDTTIVHYKMVASLVTTTLVTTMVKAAGYKPPYSLHNQ